MSKSFWKAESTIPIVQTSKAITALNGLSFEGGQLFGVGLQLAGTALSGVGTAVEALDTEPNKEAAIGEAKDLQAKTQADLEAQRQKALTGITSAAQGGAAVARQVQ